MLGAKCVGAVLGAVPGAAGVAVVLDDGVLFKGSVPVLFSAVLDDK